MVVNMLDCKTQNILGEMWQEACGRGKELRFKIISGSMSPMIEMGNIVKVSRVEPFKLRIGDIVALSDGQNVVVHRVIGTSRSNQHYSLRHRGDAGASSGITSVKNVIGRVTAIEKEGRKINLDSRSNIISNKVLGWRLLLTDSLSRMKHRHFSMVVHLALRPMWRLCRRLLFWRV